MAIIMISKPTRLSKETSYQAVLSRLKDQDFYIVRQWMTATGILCVEIDDESAMAFKLKYGDGIISADYILSVDVNVLT